LTALYHEEQQEVKAVALFSNEKIRRLIQAQPSIHLEVKDDEGWFGVSYPQGVDELLFQVAGVIKDVERLKALYALFAEVLNHLCHIGSAYETDPRIALSGTIAGITRGALSNPERPDARIYLYMICPSPPFIGGHPR
jgi:hypothetical protein